VKDPLDVQAMRRAAGLLTGFHDFRAFADSDPGETSTTVALEQVAIVETGGLLLVRVAGSHFLWKMVRRLVGVLVDVGRGGLTEPGVASLLEGSSRVPAQLTAPASGLFLERVRYPGDPGDVPLRPVILA
jgi:tRNA pseudouridine38-40 synthase|nr:hypothetical protein [Vicinamibacterales bacterium]